MVDINYYDYTPITDKNMNPKESFMNAYINNCFNSETIFGLNKRILWNLRHCIYKVRPEQSYKLTIHKNYKKQKKVVISLIKYLRIYLIVC